jgi:hypothetical protein
VSRPADRTDDWPAGPDRPARTGRHPVDPVSLVAGLLAVGIALIALLDLPVDAGVLVPVLLVAAGLVGLVAALRRDGDG